jgi:hypothetical protein
MDGGDGIPDAGSVRVVVRGGLVRDCCDVAIVEAANSIRIVRVVSLFVIFVAFQKNFVQW